MRQRRTWLLLVLLLAVTALYWRTRPAPPSAPVPPPAPAAVATPAPPSPPAPTPGSARTIRELPRRPGTVPLARREVMKRLELPDSPAVAIYRQLLPAANAGDATAAYELAMLLSDCHAVPVDEAEVEKTIATVSRTHMNIDTAVRYPALFAADLHRKFAHCAGLDADQRSGYYRWLEQAADAGELDALENFELFDPPGDICRQYFFDRCPADQQAASRAARHVIAHYLLAAVDAGSLSALWQAGSAYLDGELFDENDVAAYAHLLAYERASRAFGLADPVAGLVRDLHRKLRPGDLAAGAAQARDLLANPKCCVLIQ